MQLSNTARLSGQLRLAEAAQDGRVSRADISRLLLGSSTSIANRHKETSGTPLGRVLSQLPYAVGRAAEAKLEAMVEAVLARGKCDVNEPIELYLPRLDSASSQPTAQEPGSLNPHSSLRAGGSMEERSQKPLEIALHFQNQRITGLLLEHGATAAEDLLPKTLDQLRMPQSQQHAAFLSKLAMSLISNGADVNASGPEGGKPLELAVEASQFDNKALDSTVLISALLDNGADPNARGRDGLSPLRKLLLQLVDLQSSDHTHAGSRVTLACYLHVHRVLMACMQSSKARNMEASALALIHAGANVDGNDQDLGRGGQESLLELAIRITHEEIFQA